MAVLPVAYPGSLHPLGRPPLDVAIPAKRLAWRWRNIQPGDEADATVVVSKGLPESAEISHATCSLFNGTDGRPGRRGRAVRAEPSGDARAGLAGRSSGPGGR